MSNLVALQIIGSPTSDFFYNLSFLYGKGVVKPAGFDLLFVVAHPDGKWSVQESIGTQSEKISLSRMLEKVQHADVAIPHLFCQKGLTSIRILFEEVLNIPLVGSSGHVLNIAQDKKMTKLIATAAGIRVPAGIVLSNVEEDLKAKQRIDFPVIIKPNNADNSDGLTLATGRTEFQEGLKKAFQFDDSVLVENYIPGREIRGAIIDLDGALTALPFIEYGVHAAKPIRYAEDKLKFDEAGNLLSQSDKLEIPAHCPASIDQDLNIQLSIMMKKMHLALGARSFSMYDFRVHAETGVPYLLEAGLFWSFSETSMISAMLRVNNMNLREVTGKMWRATIRKK